MAVWDKKILWAVMLVLTGALGERVNYPGPVWAVKGSTVTLPCSFTPLKSVNDNGREVLIEIIRVVWCKNHLICQGSTPSVYDSESNNNNPRYRYLGDKKGDCTLQISHLQEEDDATFRFRMEANDVRGHFTGQSGVRVRVIGALGQRVNYPDPVCGIKGSTVTLPCSFTPLKSAKIIRVVWCKNHKFCRGHTPLFVYDSESNNNNSRYRYLGDQKGDCTLQISDLQEEDDTTFRFRVVANDVRASFTGQSGVRVTVVDQMKIRSSRDDGEFKRGEEVTLNCTTICSIHQLEVTWFRDGSALSESDPTLHLSYLTAKDSGNYTCGLKKNKRTLSEPYSLHVEADEEDGIKMKIRSSRDDGEFKRGDTITLNCTTNCTIHQLEVTWFRDGSAFTETGPTLHLSYLTAKDSGNYTCGLKENNRTLSVPYSLHVEADEEGGGYPGGGGGGLRLIVGLVFGVLLVLFTVILVVYIIKRKRAAGQDQTAVGRDRGQQHYDNIYSNDFLPLAEQQGPSSAVEEVSYASVQFTHKKQARPAEEMEDSIIYSAVA